MLKLKKRINVKTLNLLLKTSKEKEKSEKLKRFAEGAIALPVESIAATMPLTSDFWGFYGARTAYGIYNNHPVVGFAFGPAGVIGAKAKDRNGKDELASIAGVAAGGAAGGALTHHLLSESLSNYSKKQLMTGGALYGLGAYALGRLFGKKKPKKKKESLKSILLS